MLHPHEQVFQVGMSGKALQWATLMGKPVEWPEWAQLPDNGCATLKHPLVVPAMCLATCELGSVDNNWACLTICLVKALLAGVFDCVDMAQYTCTFLVLGHVILYLGNFVAVGVVVHYFIFWYIVSGIICIIWCVC